MSSGEILCLVGGALLLGVGIVLVVLIARTERRVRDLDEKGKLSMADKITAYGASGAPGGFHYAVAMAISCIGVGIVLVGAALF